MQRKPTFGILFAALLAAGLVGAGCKKEGDKSKDEESAKETSDEAADEGAAKKAREKETGGSDDTRKPAGTGFAVFPADADFVASLSIESLRESALWKKYRDEIMEGASGGFAQFEEACGVAPMEAFDSFIAGGKSEKEEEVVIVLSGMKRDQIESCSQTLAKKEGQSLEISKEGKLSRFKTKDESYWGAWLDDQTLVLSMNPDKAFIEARASGEDGLDGNEEFMNVLGQVDGSATFWFAAMPAEGSEMAKNFQQMGGTTEALFASVKLGDGLNLDGGLRMATAQAAKRAATLAQQGLQMATQQAQPLAKFIKKVVIRDADTDVIVQLKLTEAELKELGQTIEKLMQGMGGMFGQGM